MNHTDLERLKTKLEEEGPAVLACCGCLTVTFLSLIGILSLITCKITHLCP